MFLIALFLVAGLNNTSGWISIPTPTQYDIHGMLGANFSFSLPFYTEDPFPGDPVLNPDPMNFTFTFHYGLRGKAELALSMYTPSLFSLSGNYIIKKGGPKSPTFYCGIENISYNTNISTLGGGDDAGFVEEAAYNSYRQRPWELFSAYIAMKQSFSVVNFIIGLGRGRFVGYGWRSHIFNTDLFVLGSDYADPNAQMSFWALGLFAGGSLKFPFGLELIAEMDGRDAAVGAQYHHKYFTTTLAISKFEYIIEGSRPWSPRLTLGVEGNNRFMLEGPTVGSIVCEIKDNNTKAPIPDAVVDIKEVNKRYKATGGTFTMSLPVGNYTITIIKPNYEDYMAKISVKAGTKSKLIFNLKKTADALKLEAAAMDKEKNIKTYFEQGKIYYSEGSLGDAKTSFQMVLSLNPDHQEAKNYLAQIDARKLELIAVYSSEAKSRTQAKDWPKALEYWNKVLELDANHAEAKTGVANLQKQIAAAKAPPKEPTKPPKPVEPKATAAEITALYNRGVTNFVAEQYDEALKIFKQVLALDPNHAGAKDYKSRTEARLKVMKGGG